jgi:hypothetical protein
MDSEPSVTRCRPPRRRQYYHPREYPAVPIEALELACILGRVLPADLLAALAGERGPVFHIRGDAA